MATENDFNAKLSANFKKLESQGFLTLKMAEKYHIGIPDFLIWHDGRCAGLEVKFVKELPKGRGKVLGHAFDGRQLTFLQRIAMAGGPAWGLVVVHSEKKMYLFYFTDIPEGGNWSGTLPEDRCTTFDYGQWTELAYKLFKEPRWQGG
jgi:hypothetical protein